MSVKIKKVLFVDKPGVDSVITTDHRGWIDAGSVELTDGYVLVKGRRVVRSERNFNSSIISPRGKSYHLLNLVFGDWIRGFIAELDWELSVKIYSGGSRDADRDITPVDAIVVRTSRVVDIMAAAMTNTFWAGNKDKQKVPTLLEVNKALLDNLDRDAAYEAMETRTSLGENPSFPENTGFSRPLMEYLTGERTNSLIQSGRFYPRWDYLLAMSGQTVIGMRPMLAEILPYIGALLFTSKRDLSRFARHMTISEDQVVLIEKSGKVNQEAYARFIYNAIESARTKERSLTDRDILTLIAHYPRIARFDPEKIRAFLLKSRPMLPGVIQEQRVLAELLKLDLKDSFKTIDEIHEAIKEIRARVKMPERF